MRGEAAQPSAQQAAAAAAAAGAQHRLLSLRLNCMHCRCSAFQPNPFFPQLCSNEKCVHDREDHVASSGGKNKRKRGSASRKSGGSVGSAQGGSAGAVVVSMTSAGLSSTAASGLAAAALEAVHARLDRVLDRYKAIMSMLARARVPAETMGLLRRSHLAESPPLSVGARHMLEDRFGGVGFGVGAPPLEATDAAEAPHPACPWLSPCASESPSSSSSGDEELPKKPRRRPPVVRPASAAYEGEEQSGVPCGRGRARYADGSRFEGEWSAGRPDGAGVLRVPGVGTIEGRWARGALEGEARLRWSDGSEERCLFRGGARACPPR